MRVGCVQLRGSADRDRNLAIAEQLVRDAARQGAEVIVLPEKWNLIGESAVLLAGAESLDGESMSAVRSWCKELGVWIVAGSFVELVEGREKRANTSPLFNPDGELCTTYRKMHMFDVEVGGVSYRESDHEEPGDDIVVTSIDAKSGMSVPYGLTVCYDLRFPELYRILAVMGAKVVTVPAAFTLFTGKDHWEVLLRARAIENQCFMVASNQVGEHGAGKVSYGRSMIVDPWGIVLAQAADTECAIVADLDFAELDRIRETLPSLATRRSQSYVWPA